MTRPPPSRRRGPSAAAGRRAASGAQLAAWGADAAVLQRRPRRPSAPVPCPRRVRFAGPAASFGYAAQLLRRQGHTLLVLTMALGVGAPDGAVRCSLRRSGGGPYPWPDADRLVRAFTRRARGAPPGPVTAAPTLQNRRGPRHDHHRVGLGGGRVRRCPPRRAIGDAERSEVAWGHRRGLLPLLGGRPAVGRPFDLLRPGRVSTTPLTVLSHGLGLCAGGR
jgi:hypothetical protein